MHAGHIDICMYIAHMNCWYELAIGKEVGDIYNNLYAFRLELEKFVHVFTTAYECMYALV